MHAECDQFLRALPAPDSLKVADCLRIIALMRKFTDVLPPLLAVHFAKLVAVWKELTFIGSLELLAPCSRLPVLEDFARQVIGDSADTDGVLMIKHVYLQILPFLQQVLLRFENHQTALQEQIHTLQAEIDAFNLDQINAEWESKVSAQLNLVHAAHKRETETLEKVASDDLS